jgi:hypothetical protein
MSDPTEVLAALEAAIEVATTGRGCRHGSEFQDGTVCNACERYLLPALPALVAVARAANELERLVSPAGDDTICTCGMSDTGSGECEFHVAHESAQVTLDALARVEP